MVDSVTIRITTLDNSIVINMDQSEEVGPLEAKTSSQKQRIGLPPVGTHVHTGNSVEQNVEKPEFVEGNTYEGFKNSIDSKKTVTIYIPMDIHSLRNRNGRMLETEHSTAESDGTMNQSSRDEEPKESAFVSSPKPSIEKMRPGSPRHSRIRSNSNLGALSAQGKVLVQHPSVITRRHNPSVTASWIQSKDNKMRNTWSSRAEANLSIKLVSMDSPVSSPRKRSLNSLDIHVTAPPQYVRHRCRQKSFSTPPKNVTPPTHRKSDHQHFFPTTSQSSLDENREGSVTSTESSTPYNPYQSVLSVSFGLDANDLDVPEDNNVIRMDVAPTRRHRSVPSFSPKPDEGVLIDVSDTSHAGSIVNVKDDFESLDLSNIASCPSSVCVPHIEYNRDAQDTLMELIDRSDMQHEWEGEELLGSNDDEENMLFYSNDKPKIDSIQQSEEEVKEGIAGPKESESLQVSEVESERDPIPCTPSTSMALKVMLTPSSSAIPSPSPPPLQKEVQQSISPLHTVDPLSFSISDYLSLSPEDRETARQYRKQQEEQEQEKRRRHAQMEREREKLSVQPVQPVEEIVESQADDDNGEILRRFEEEFQKRMQKKEEEEDRKKAETIENAKLVLFCCSFNV